jgi:hypothetical protein
VSLESISSAVLPKEEKEFHSKTHLRVVESAQVPETNVILIGRMYLHCGLLVFVGIDYT